MAAYITRKGSSLNQKAVNLHMLEDMLGWVVMRFTDISILDPIMSIGATLFILSHAIQNLKEVLHLFLEKVHHGISA